ncbi:MAG TPA: cytochrome c peroxidase [Chryseolinea sp.]
MRIVIVFFFLLVVCACSDDVVSSEKKPTPVNLVMPSNFPSAVYDLSSNPLTEEGIALGKMLFYDPILSRDNTISCGFCHQQASAFTHHGHDLSHGIGDKLGRRNSLPIQNLIWYKSFFWDGGVHNLDLVPLNAISNPVEMDEDTKNLIVKLQGQPRYRDQFKLAFESGEINSTFFLQALSQFLATMVSANSPYDKYIRHEGVQFNADQLDGHALFEQHCSGCHATDLFTDQSYRNNGFSSAADLLNDPGREEITLNPEDRGKFKVPSLRNVAYTAPYMHNGKLGSLEEVLDFYSSGVQASSTLDPLLTINDQPGIALTNDDKKKIIAFLMTLSDEQFLNDRRFSEY